jgi:hypothetical protein
MKQKAVLTTKTKGRSIEPTQAFDQTSRGQLLNDDRSKDGNKSTNKNDTKVQRVDDGNVSKQRCQQVVSTRTRRKVFVVALQQELLYGGTRTSSIVQKPETILPTTHPKWLKKYKKYTPRAPKGASYPGRNCTLLYFCTFKSTKPGT